MPLTIVNELGRKKTSYVYHHGQLYRQHIYSRRFIRCTPEFSNDLTENLKYFHDKLQLQEKSTDGLNFMPPSDRTYLIEEYYVCKEARTSNPRVHELTATTTFAFIPVAVSKRWFSSDVYLKKHQSSSKSKIQLGILEKITVCDNLGNAIPGSSKPKRPEPKIIDLTWHPADEAQEFPPQPRQPAVRRHTPNPRRTRALTRCSVCCTSRKNRNYQELSTPLNNVVGEGNSPTT